jgi:alkylhydroperoxidase family enzyme
MLSWLMRRRIAAFERDYDYPMDYAREILEASPRALLLYGRIAALANYRRKVPAAAFHAAKVVSAKTEDCGPCTQLAVTMAERAGVPPAELRAVLAGDEKAMSEEVALACRFAEAVLAHDPRADDLRAAVVARWGRHGLVSLAYAIAAVRLFPTVKYALGHGQSCTRVTVAGSPVPVLRQAA